MSLTPLLNSPGMVFRHLCLYTHQQNGKSERKHKHIMETWLTLLAQASLPLLFWWHVFQTFVYLINKLSSFVLNFDTPFHRLFNKQPNYSKLKVFGCTVYLYLRPYHPHKFSYHSTKYVFLGYSLLHKGYMCVDSSGRLYIVLTLKFLENEFPFISDSTFSHFTTFNSYA